MKTFHCVYDILRLITDRVTFDEFYAPLYINKHATVEHVDDYTTIIIMYTYNSYVYVSDYAAFFCFSDKLIMKKSVHSTVYTNGYKPKQ